MSYQTSQATRTMQAIRGFEVPIIVSFFVISVT
jgi:hypothetical protein